MFSKKKKKRKKERAKKRKNRNDRKKDKNYSVRFDISYASRVTGKRGVLHSSRLPESKVSKILQNY